VPGAGVMGAGIVFIGTVGMTRRIMAGMRMAIKAPPARAPPMIVGNGTFIRGEGNEEVEAGRATGAAGGTIGGACGSETGCVTGGAP
jgi:hypothetical protein